MKKKFFYIEFRILLLLSDVYAASADSGAWMTRYFDNNVVRQVFEIKKSAFNSNAVGLNAQRFLRDRWF